MPEITNVWKGHGVMGRDGCERPAHCRVLSAWAAETNPFHQAGVWSTDVPAWLQLGRCRQDCGCLEMGNLSLSGALPLKQGCDGD